MRYVISLLITFTYLIKIEAATESNFAGGLAFRSHETNQEERTSMAIPAMPGKLKFDGYLAVSFDLKVRTDTDRFGYVVRVITGGDSSIDLFLNHPAGETSFLCLIKDRTMLCRVSPSQRITITDWNRIELKLYRELDSLYVALGEDIVYRAREDIRGENVSICFGINNVQGFATRDSAPFFLKNLLVETKPGHTYGFWPFDMPAADGRIKASRGKGEALLSGGDWVYYRHSNWQQVGRIEHSGKIFPVVCPESETVLLVGREQVTVVDASTGVSSEILLEDPLPVNRLANQFIYDRYSGNLLNYDFERDSTQIISVLDLNTGRWSVPVLRENGSGILQHNSFISPLDSSLIQLFGYGYHRYNRQWHRITTVNEVSSGELPDYIPPRYFSSVGVCDSVVYIYGGLGNELGTQEYGVHNFNDLYRLDLKTFDVETLWRKENMKDNLVAASDLIISECGGYAKALFFDPKRYSSFIILQQLDLASGKLTQLGDTIPFYFRDTESYARLFESSAGDKFYAVTVGRTENGTWESRIYSIFSPVLEISGHSVKRALPVKSILIYSLLLLIAGMGLVMFFELRKRSKTGKLNPVPAFPDNAPDTGGEKKSGIKSSDVHEPGIYLLNGFQVIDGSRKEITGEFTPIMRQLLSLIILYSAKGKKGISNVRLKEILWYDKSDESSRNNRNVNIHKIRLLLDTIGTYELSNSSSYWKFSSGEGFRCDYIEACDILEQAATDKRYDKATARAVIRAASMGPLLPNMQFDWLDGMKAEYSDGIIHTIHACMENSEVKADNTHMLNLCDAALRFDSLDEKSVMGKCVALVNLKRIGAAHRAYDLFRKEYSQVMGEELSASFEDFIKTFQ